MTWPSGEGGLKPCWHQEAVMGCCSLDPSCPSGLVLPCLTLLLPSHLGLAGGTGQETIFLEWATAEEGKWPCSFCQCKRPGEPAWLLGQCCCTRAFWGSTATGVRETWHRQISTVHLVLPVLLRNVCSCFCDCSHEKTETFSQTTPCSAPFLCHLPAPLVSLGGSCARREGQAALKRQRKAEK